MRGLWFLSALILVALGSALAQNQPAYAGFHCMRINEVMAGLNGNTNIQLVELKMEFAGETVVSGTQLHFFSATGTETATFTFPSSLNSLSTELSILIGTQAFKDLAGIVDPDFVFVTPGDPTPDTVNSIGNPVPNPVPASSGKVTFTGGFNCNFSGTLIDSVAYGSFSGDNTGFGTPAAALPATGVSSLQLTAPMLPHNNSTEYSLGAPSPRNNLGQTSTFTSDADGDGVIDASDLCPGTAMGATVDTFGCSAAQVDSDGDTICNPGAPSAGPAPGCTGNDNCPSISNMSQANADGDAWGDACDNCPSVFTLWFVPLGDGDCDGFTKALETGIGTDPLVACHNNAGLPDWPPDFNDDKSVNILDVFTMFPFWLGVSTRHNLQLDSAINILDVFQLFPFWLKTCT